MGIPVLDGDNDMAVFPLFKLELHLVDADMPGLGYDFNVGNIEILTGLLCFGTEFFAARRLPPGVLFEESVHIFFRLEQERIVIRDHIEVWRFRLRDSRAENHNPVREVFPITIVRLIQVALANRRIETDIPQTRILFLQYLETGGME